MIEKVTVSHSGLELASVKAGVGLSRDPRLVFYGPSGADGAGCTTSRLRCPRGYACR